MIAAGATPRITLPQLAQFAEGDLVVPAVPAHPSAREAFIRSGIDGASIDTRTITPGALFVPLPGSRTDGHAFLAEAFERGAGAALCERARYEAWRGREPGPLVLVENATLALTMIAHRYRAQWHGLLVGVTGSSGKTTTKDLVAAVCGTATPTLKTEGNLNNHWGVPLTLLRLLPEHRVAVVEIAMSAPGEIEELAHVAHPGAAIVTNAGRAHLEKFGGVDSIAREKMALARALAPHEVAFVGADAPALRGAMEGVRARVVTYGLAADATVRPDTLEDLGPGGSRFTVAGFPPVHLALIGRHMVANALAALAVAREFGIDPAAAVRALEAHRPVRGRMELRAARGATLLVDCYNANPDATRAALETLAEWPGATRRIAVLGDMLELGATAAALHRETGAAVRNAELWAVGAHAADYAAGAAAAGVPARTFADRESARAALIEALAPGVVALIKASRGAALEIVIEGLGEGNA
jgi:UDP-N-acetylmuramoyl-tripeptide--D-alanyl-D-alanine ligase